MRVIGQEAIADVFGVAPKTIVEWQEHGFPVAVRGRRGIASEYETSACIAWVVDREVRRVAGESPQDRLARAKAEEVELRNLERRGLLIRADQLEPKLRAAIVSARESLLEMTPRLARLPGDAQAREDALKAAVHEFLNRFADWAKDAREDVDDDTA